jgi:hypothetical protein
MTVLSPIESEFPTPEEAEAHDLWVRAKVKASLDDPRPGLPHDEVMARAEAVISRAKQQRRGKA